jgi:hypothetical protein
MAPHQRRRRRHHGRHHNHRVRAAPPPWAYLQAPYGAYSFQQRSGPAGGPAAPFDGSFSNVAWEHGFGFPPPRGYHHQQQAPLAQPAAGATAAVPQQQSQPVAVAAAAASAAAAAAATATTAAVPVTATTMGTAGAAPVLIPQPRVLQYVDVPTVQVTCQSHTAQRSCCCGPRGCGHHC